MMEIGLPVSCSCGTPMMLGRRPRCSNIALWRMCATMPLQCVLHSAGIPGEAFATVDKALDERTIGHNPERLCLMKVRML